MQHMQVPYKLEYLEQDSGPASYDFREEKEELERVLSHPEISRSANLVRFLSFICRKYFEGKAEEIREYTIAVEALGRKKSCFDSHEDPIVRVTARTIRKRLGEFYRNVGKSHSVQIVLPLGHYVPQFIRCSAPSEESNPAASLVSVEDLHANCEFLDNRVISAISEENVDREAAHIVVEVPLQMAGRKFLWRFVCFVILLLVVFFAGIATGRHMDDRPDGRIRIRQATPRFKATVAFTHSYF